MSDQIFKTLVAEGIESALSIKQASGGREKVYSSISAKNLSNLDFRLGRQIHFCIDKDRSETGKKEALKAARKLRAKGIEVFIHEPKGEIPNNSKGIDFQDVHQDGQDGLEIIRMTILNSSISFDDILPDKLYRLSDVKEIETHWLCYPYFPQAKLIIVEGDPGIGKSSLCLKWVAELSQGLGFFGLEPIEPTIILLLCSEDGLEDTIKPRLNKAGGDHSRIFAYKAPMILNDEGREKLEELILATKCKLIVIDPLVSLLGGGMDMNKANDVRCALNILIELADKYQVTIIALRHLVKGDRSKAIYRGIGSIDFTAACRSVLHVAKNPEKENSGVIFHIKSNLAPLGDAQGYDIVDGKIVWTGKSNIKMEDTMVDSHPKKSASLESAVTFLEEYLANGPALAQDIFADARAKDIKDKTLYRAKDQLKIESVKISKGWLWKLPKDDGHHFNIPAKEEL